MKNKIINNYNFNNMIFDFIIFENISITYACLNTFEKVIIRFRFVYKCIIHAYNTPSYAALIISIIIVPFKDC